MDEKSFESRQGDFRLSIQGFRKPVFEGIPEHVYALVRVDDIVSVPNEQIVQIVGVENWFYFSVSCISSFLLDVPIRFNH
jgi:hypothetical protein